MFGSQAQSSGLKKLVTLFAMLNLFKPAPVESIIEPRSAKVKAVFAAGKDVLTSAVKPATATPYNFPFVKPALSISFPVLFLVPT